MPHQLPLDLEVHDRFSRDNFVVTEALEGVVEALLQPDQWLSPHVILLGPSGSGKTHLGHIFARQFHARFVTAEASHTLDLARLANTPYVVDDSEHASQEVLFHLNNHVQKFSQKLVLLTNTHPLAWKIHVPDLGSRLRAMRLLTLHEPDDALLIAILKKLFAQRAISPSDDALDFLARRMERSVAAAQKIVTDLEQYANGRAFNRTLARDFFDETSRLQFNDQDFDDFDT